ncbi:MAG TPA: patatin-like phospholipase family protein [Paraburkholderia sp.]
MASIESLPPDSAVQPRRSQSTAFVFAGGGSLGAIEVGMLRELVRHGECPTCVVGSSAGAINAAYFAGSPNSEGIAKLESLWRQIRRQDIMPFSMHGLFDLVFRHRPHLVEAGALRALLEKNFPFARIEQAVIPLHVVATEVLSGSEVVLSSGPVVDAILASTAIPGVFPPVRIGNMDLVDGGVADNTPISVAIRLGVTRIIVLSAGFACSLQAPPASAIAQALHALTLVIARQLVRDLAFYATRADIFVVPPLCPLHVSPYDYTQCGSLIDQAAAITRDWLDSGGLDHAFVPDELQQYSPEPG